MVIAFTAETEADDRLLSELDRRHKDFGDLRSQVLVVMPLTAADAREKGNQQDFTLPILADSDGEMARDFSVEFDPESPRRTVVVADKEGREVRRFEPHLSEDEPTEVVEGLIYAVRAIGSGTLTPKGSDVDSEDDFLTSIADQARVPLAETPLIVERFLEALAPHVDAETIRTLTEMVPAEIDVDVTPGPEEELTVDDFLIEMSDEAAVASGRAVEHARVVAEAFARRATESQLARLRETVADEEILALFETERGELTGSGATTPGIRQQSEGHEDHQASE